jgi:beta-galactosidase GanA
LTNEIKRNITISNELFQVKNKNVCNKIVDLDNKLGEQIVTIQTDHVRNYKNMVCSLTDLSCRIKKQANKHNSACEDSNRKVGSLPKLSQTYTIA